MGAEKPPIAGFHVVSGVPNVLATNSTHVNSCATAPLMGCGPAGRNNGVIHVRHNAVHTLPGTAA